MSNSDSPAISTSVSQETHQKQGVAEMYVGRRGPVSVITVLFPSLCGYFNIFFLLLKVPLVLDTKGFMQPKEPIVLKMVPRGHADLKK